MLLTVPLRRRVDQCTSHVYYQELMIIRDSIFDTIHFDSTRTDNICKMLLDTPVVQRLRYIRQNGCTYLTFPSGHNTRLSHALGTFRTAQEFVRTYPDLSAYEMDFKIAALLHDVGHGPFSHVFERAFHDVGINISHEAMTHEIILHDPDISAVKYNFAEPLTSVANAFNPNAESPFWYALLDGQIDIDRLEYSTRDSKTIGVPLRTDYERIKHLLTIQGRNISLEEKALDSTEDFLYTLSKLYKEVYFHKTTRGAEVILCEILRMVFEHFYTEPTNYSDATGLDSGNRLSKFIQKLVQLKREREREEGEGGQQIQFDFIADEERKILEFQAKDDNKVRVYPPHRFRDEWVALTDHTILAAVEDISDRARNERLRGFAQRFLKRDLLKAIDIRTMIYDVLSSQSPILFVHNKEVDGANSASRSIEEHIDRISSSFHQQQNEIMEGLDYLEDYAERETYRHGKSPIMIQQTGVEARNLWDISKSVRALGVLRFHRIYVDSEALSAVRRRVIDWISGQLQKTA